MWVASVVTTTQGGVDDFSDLFSIHYFHSFDHHSRLLPDSVDDVKRNVSMRYFRVRV